MGKDMLVNDPDETWAQMERLVGVANMHNGERHSFELMFRELFRASYAAKPETRKAAYRQIAFNIADLLADS